MATICLISPGHLTSNPRLVKEADALTAAGHTVEVIHGRSFPAHDVEDQRFGGRGWHVASRVPYGVLASVSFRWRQRVRQRFSILLLRLGLNHPWLHYLAIHPVCVDLIRAALSVKADLYIAHYPPALPAAALAASRAGSLYAFDAEDFHLGDVPDSRPYAMRRRLVRFVESRHIHGCSYVTAASPGIADAYVSAYGISRPSVLLNVFSRASAPSAPSARGWFSDEPSIYWFSQTIGPNRGLESALQAIALSVSRPLLVLRGFVSDDYRKSLVELASALDVLDRLRFLSHASPDDMTGLAAPHDLGIASETGYTPNNAIALSNKLFTYLLSGVPVLLSDTPGQALFASEVEDVVRLYSVNDPSSLAAAIDSFLDRDACVLAEARYKAFVIGQKRLNWESERVVLIACVESVLNA